MIRKHFHEIYLDYTPLGDLGLHVSGDDVFNSPEKEYETVEVPGKHGSLLIDSGRFKNVTLKYPAFILGETEREFRDHISKLRNFILSREGYIRLEDTYHEDEYRIVSFHGPLETEAIMLQGGEFDLEFDAKPERWLKSGEEPSTYTANGTIYNETYHNARPKLRIYGSGTVGLGQCTIQISSHSFPYLDIDADTMNAFYEVTNCNSYVNIILPTGQDFIYLHPETNGITLSGITKAIIWPRWWII